MTSRKTEALSLPGIGAKGIPVDDELRKKLLKKAGHLLARRAYSRGELRGKLETVADGTVVAEVLDRLEQLKLLNDAEYAYNFALSRIRRDGWGPAKVRYALIRRQVSSRDIAAALDRIRSELGDEYALTDYLQRYFNKKGLPKDSRSVRSLVLHLERRGFYRARILDALNRMLPRATSRLFDAGD